MVVHAGPPFTVRLRRTSMLMTDKESFGGSWADLDLVCPVVYSRVDFSPGMCIGILCKPADRQIAGKIMAGELVPVWNVSYFDKDLAWNVMHLFAGAYEGWLRAMWWLQQANLGHSFATHTSIDGCPTVMKMTLSPPCPSWSRGGKHSGLATDEGFCFLDAIEHVSRVRPVLALFECSDGLEAHHHWRVISAAMQLAGYRKVWSQDVAIHQLTCNHRTRWLAIWARMDVPACRLFALSTVV